MPVCHFFLGRVSTAGGFCGEGMDFVMTPWQEWDPGPWETPKDSQTFNFLPALESFNKHEAGQKKQKWPPVIVSHFQVESAVF